MESSPKVVSTGFALSIVLLSFVPIASAGPKEDVAAATLAWGRALGENNPDKVLPLYSDDAVLWGTLSPTVRSDRPTLRDYFVTAFKVLPGLKVAFDDQLIRVYGDGSIPAITRFPMSRTERQRACLRATASPTSRMANIGASLTTIPRPSHRPRDRSADAAGIRIPGTSNRRTHARASRYRSCGNHLNRARLEADFLLG